MSGTVVALGHATLLGLAWPLLSSSETSVSGPTPLYGDAFCSRLAMKRINVRRCRPRARRADQHLRPGRVGPDVRRDRERSERRQRGARRRRVGELIGWGITSVSANIDAVSRVRETIARTEQKMLLEKARGGA